MQNAVRMFACLLTALISTPVFADDGYVSYVVKSGDTLIDMGNRYLTTPDAYRVVQQQNKISNPKAISVGKAIRIPRNLLRYQSASAKILSVRGNVWVGSTSASAGQSVAEGAILKTAASSFVTLSLPNGSRVSMPSNSDLRIRLLRTYILGSALDYDFDVTKGGASTSVTPLQSKDDRYRIRTPRAVSAVRGTQFQVRFDDKTSRDFAEVTEGGLAVTAGVDEDIALPAGNGVAVPLTGAVIKEALLPQPKMIEPGRIQVNPEVLFAVAPQSDEAGYRITLAADAGFIEPVADVTITGNEAKLAGLGDGNYFVRARAISQNGIQGLPVTYTFKRRLNGVLTSAGKSDEGYSFKWQSDGGGIRKFHFQLFKGETGGRAMVDEPALTDMQITLSDLPTGDYYWRVGAVQFTDGEVATNWTAFEKISVNP